MVTAATNAIERIMARRQIQALINSAPVDVVLNRKTKVSTPGGGWRWGPSTPLAPQRVTLIPFKRRMTEFLVSTELGEVPDLPYVLLGLWDLDIAEEDWFEHNGDKFEVKTLDLKKDVRIAAHVDYYGANRDG